MSTDGSMCLYVFARFSSRPGCERDLERALLKVLGPTRAEPGCQAIHVYRPVGESRSFYVHAKWQDEASFNRHAELPHTLEFIQEVSALIDHRLQVVRTRRLS